MIIDTHVHIGKTLNFNMKESEVLYSMQKYGIDFSLVSNIESAECDHKQRKLPFFLQKSQIKSNIKAINFAVKYPDKIGAMVWIKPNLEKCDEDFIKLVRDNRDVIYGMKIHPFHSAVAPDDERLEPYYKLAKELRLPVVSHTGGCEQASSIHLYNVAKKHPEINFVMVHMDLGTDNSQAIQLLGELPNLYGDTTWVSVNSTLKAIKLYGSEKILFGSDNPIDGKDTYLHNKTGDRSLYQEYFNEFKSKISCEDYENIMYKNAKKVFKI